MCSTTWDPKRPLAASRKYFGRLQQAVEQEEVMKILTKHAVEFVSLVPLSLF